MAPDPTASSFVHARVFHTRSSTVARPLAASCCQPKDLGPGEIVEASGSRRGGLGNRVRTVVGSRLIPHEHGVRLREVSSLSTDGCGAIERVIGPGAFGIPPVEAWRDDR